MAQIEFRDGAREVPNHLAEMMNAFQTYRMTYEEATRKANERLTAEFLNRTQQTILNTHFKRPF